jgi:hypothetical protein
MTTHGPGETAAVYATHAQVTAFGAGMALLAEVFTAHPELRGLQATVDQAGHVDIIAYAEHGVLRDWIHALPAAKRTKGLFTLQSGPAYEEVLTEGSLTIHVRPRGGVA